MCMTVMHPNAKDNFFFLHIGLTYDIQYTLVRSNPAHFISIYQGGYKIRQRKENQFSLSIQKLVLQINPFSPPVQMAKYKFCILLITLAIYTFHLSHLNVGD